MKECCQTAVSSGDPVALHNEKYYCMSCVMDLLDDQGKRLDAMREHFDVELEKTDWWIQMGETRCRIVPSEWFEKAREILGGE